MDKGKSEHTVDVIENIFREKIPSNQKEIYELII